MVPSSNSTIMVGILNRGTKQCACLDGQHRRKFHDIGQRYTSPSSGKCKPLTVQVAKLRRHWGSRSVTIHGYKETRIKSNPHLLTQLAIRLAERPKTLRAFVTWVPTWAWYICVLFLPRKRRTFTDSYKPFVMKYVGQLFAARSPREHSILSSTDRRGKVHAITHATHPRRLVYFDRTLGGSGSWVVTEEAEIVMHQRYIAISFCYRDFLHGEKGSVEEADSREAFIQKVRTVVRGENFDAYWLDVECIDGAVRARDLYRMADVYRQAESTLVMISHEGGWKTWGDRFWTLPEALLSRALRCKVGDGAVFPLPLEVVAEKAYAQYAPWSGRMV